MNNINTFKTARLKLTAWYLIIIMLISVLFSVVIYVGVSHQLSRVNQLQELSLTQEGDSLASLFREFAKEQEAKGRPISPSNQMRLFHLNPNIASEIRTQLTTILVLVNFGILGIAGFAGYFLAGRTLRPIKEIMDEQNRFITDASHELKTPLTALRTEFEVAMLDGDKITPSQSKQLIKSSFEEIVSLQGLAENLIELTQQQKKRGHLKLSDVSLLEIIEAALKKVVPLAKQKHITINNDVDDYILEGEHQSLTELFVILLDNAIKYNPQGSEVKLLSKKTDHHIQIVITDNGIGIDEKDLAHIFDRFYRADKSRSKIAGYGLGLAIAKEIVESHKGTITVESKPEQGTTFTLQFPLKQAV